MREIKFRAWIKEDEIMTYFEDESYILNGDMSVDAFDYEKRDCENYFEPCYKTVDVELMQFTGLHDKNGKEIYEGDIVLVNRAKGQVKWLNNKGKYVIVFPISDYAEIAELGDNIEILEVIGNIYDNIDLLEED